MLQRRLFTTKFSHRQVTTPVGAADAEAAGTQNKKWRIKQVTRSNFNELLDEVKTRIFDADFIAISLQNTGAFSAPWQKVSSFDTPDTAYSKARRAAERFQVLQFALCPFSVKDSIVTAYPYNFRLFPRDELKLGMPSYSFSCQISYMTSMARLGFDFNSCIYDGISYLSREQESAAKYQLGNAFLGAEAIVSSWKASSVGDSVFVERIRHRVRSWIDACKDQDPLLRSLRKLVAGNESYDSRPSMDIDVCSERQVHLSFEVLKQYSDEVVTLIVPSKSGGTQAVRIVLTSSKEDKALFEAETRNVEEQKRKQIRGFGEVIDLISASGKPIVSHNSLDDFTFIHSKFVSPLPSSMAEFEQSIRSLFPCVLDLNHLMAEVSPQSNMTNLPAALSYMRNRFFAPIDIQIPHHGSSAEVCDGKVYGHNVIRVSHLFAKLFVLLQQNRSKPEAGGDRDQGFHLKHHANIFSRGHISSLDSLSDEDVQVSQGKNRSTRKLSSKDLVFLWGFEQGISEGKLKRLLTGSHPALSEEDVFDVKLVDKSCAMLAFWRSELSGGFIEAMSSGGVGHEGLVELVSEGLKAANYEAYRRACEMEIWESNLGDSLDIAVSMSCDAGDGSEVDERSAFEIFWDNEVVKNLDDE